MSVISRFAGLVAAAALLIITAPAWAQQQLGDLPNNVTTTEHGDWILLCAETPDGQRCEMVQTLSQRDNGREQRLVQTNIGITPNGQRLLQIVMPLGIDLRSGIAITIDEGEEIQLPYQTCLPDGCLVLFPLDDTWFNRMRAGNELRIGFRGFGQSEVLVIEKSLRGFTAASNGLR
ncbi:Invasion protein IalB, involved in pathogenesis [Ectothiorhodosinus mongolicus]|uniref:Invasion protein IalB, involved in pathogenesis n=1 Tax=Ectothiorhodosinus mongolicus TaxID=233100 RepID=A0A1R3VMG8_9GAMM|nr:invasion associated locus B family protein [Ectothiorhodosinus mongolicus]ULX56242.1 invasion associated locus B family protein [Ectothiorhodosinus mongolicus]SIT65746.1 Invasion protein IalB, involved in pathogenesis [Ectothiorhodosinus mongolicus]